MADNAKELLTPDQYWELENKKLDQELEIKKLEIASNEKIAVEANKVASETNKVGFWANIINGAKVVGYILLGVVYLVVSLISKKDDQAFELEDNYRAKESSKWSQRIFDRAKSFVDGLKS